MLIPCIDYVAWNGEGEISDGSSSVLRPNTSRGSSSDDDLEMGTTRNGEERYPLLSSQSSSMSGGSTIRGRVPLINTMESDLGDAGDLVANEEVPAVSTPRFGASLSRRAPLSGSGI